MQSTLPPDKKNFKKKPNSDATALMANNLGKLPPQSIELEEAVLCACMMDKNAAGEIMDILKPECFYKESHVIIFGAISKLFHSTPVQDIDVFTVISELERTHELENAGGKRIVLQLTDRVASAANIIGHARIVLEKHIQRELIRISSETIRDAFDSQDAFVLLDSAESKLFKVAEINIKRNHASMTDLVKQALKDIAAASTTEEGVTGVRTGFTALDRVTYGWQKSDLIIIAARPSMGKTAFVLSLARNSAVEWNHPVAFFSLEMSNIQLVNRLIASETEIPSKQLRTGKLSPEEWQHLNKKLIELENAPLYIDDTPSLSIFEFRAKSRRLKAKQKIELIIVDYLQLMTAGNENRGNREQEISSISRSLKSIAKELNVPIIALSQLSRNVETRGGVKKPQLSDLRESGAIEQDADMVIFIYRPEYYEIFADEQGNSTAGVANIIISKHRNGALAEIPLRFIKELAKFGEFSSHDFVTEEHIDHPPQQHRETRPSKLNQMSREEEPPF